MIYKVISEWLTEKITLLNNTLSFEERLKPADANFDMDMLPANLKDNSYLIKLKNIDSEDNESGEIKVNAVIQFHFRLYKKPLKYYRSIIDEKLFPLSKILTDDTQAGLERTADGITIANINNITITQLDKAFKGGEFIFPIIEFELQIFN